MKYLVKLLHYHRLSKKKTSPLYVQQLKIEHGIDFSFIPTEDFNLFYQTFRSCCELQSQSVVEIHRKFLVCAPVWTKLSLISNFFRILTLRGQHLSSENHGSSCASTCHPYSVISCQAFFKFVGMRNLKQQFHDGHTWIITRKVRVIVITLH